MLRFYTALTAFLAPREEKGATATEYALIIAVIALVILGAMSVFGDNLSSFWSGLGSSLPS